MGNTDPTSVGNGPVDELTRTGDLKMIRRILVLGAVACAMLAVGLAAPASAQTYQGCVATLSDTTPSPGQTITVSGTGAKAGAHVSASIGGVTIGTGTAAADGSFSFNAVVPSDASGTVTVTVDCNADNPNSVVEAITITVGATTTAPLPVTGSSSTLPLTKLAVVLLSAGALMLVVSRRRSTKSVKTEV
jgi:LPXTG-motif cell wall-anchored protein